MSGRTGGKITATRQTFLLIAVTVALLTAMSPSPRVSALPLTQRSVRVSNGLAAQSGVTYRVAFSTLASGTIGSVRIELCSSPIVDEACTAPAGFDIANAALASQTGITGFVISPNTTANSMVLSRTPAFESPASATYTFTGISNPSNGGSVFGRVYTYPTSDGSGPYTDAGGLALYFHGGLGVSAEVPPYLRFCVGESITGFDCNTATEAFTDLGVLSSAVTSAAQSQMVVATNAANGYSMWAIGGTMTSGSNTIAAMAGGGPSTEGTPQFGLNLAANTDPVVGQSPSGPGTGTPAAPYATPNIFRYNSGDTLAGSPNPDDNRKYTVSYIVNIPTNQPGGLYATTLTYIALANF